MQPVDDRRSQRDLPGVGRCPHENAPVGAQRVTDAGVELVDLFFAEARRVCPEADDVQRNVREPLELGAGVDAFSQVSGEPHVPFDHLAVAGAPVGT